MAKKKTTEAKLAAKKSEPKAAKVSELVKAKNIVKASMHVANGKIKIVAFAKDGECHRRESDLDGKDSVDLTLA